MKYLTFITGFLVAAALLFSGCKAPQPVEPAAEEASYHYSPFVVQVPESDMVFGVISFKDVGIKRQSLDMNDPLLEAIAQAVSYELQTEPSLAVTQTLVDYDEAMTDPANHMSCEENHLYVDLWNGSDRWGYSLWSGCGESDNFAWNEIEIPGPAENDIASKVEPLGTAITKSLVEAHAKSCFTKTCTCGSGKC